MVFLIAAMTVPEARSDPRLRRYPLRRLRLPVAGGNLSLVVPDAGAWLRTGAWLHPGDLARAARHGAEPPYEPPYWADVWPAAVAIARWLCRRRDLGGRRCLDLGCGVGVPGAAALRQGACVTFADREDDALAFAAWNGSHLGAGKERLVAVRHDWHAGTIAGCFDVICLADVTYRPVHHAPVLRHLRACLAASGLAIHADPFRAESDGFLVQARAEFAERRQVAATHFADQRLPVRLSFFARAERDLARWLGDHTGPAAPPGDGSAGAPATAGSR